MVNIGAFHVMPALRPGNQRLQHDNHLATLAQVPETGAPVCRVSFWVTVKEVIVAGRTNWLGEGAGELSIARFPGRQQWNLSAFLCLEPGASPTGRERITPLTVRALP